MRTKLLYKFDKMELAYLLLTSVLLTRHISGIVPYSDADVERKVFLLEQKVAQLETWSKFQGTSSSYVRWGRTVCNTYNGTDLVYKGYMAGHHYTEPSGGAEFLCLPHDATWTQPGPTHALNGVLYGTEYALHAGLGNNFIQNIPCSLCKTRRTNVAMFPARTNCFPGWTLEYAGYLAAGARTHSLTNYVCVDSNPESSASGSVNDDHAVLYNVETQCGSLPCPPYVDGRVLACAVCSI